MGGEVNYDHETAHWSRKTAGAVVGFSGLALSKSWRQPRSLSLAPSADTYLGRYSLDWLGRESCSIRARDTT
jgi:hypothetical protein